MKLLFKEKGMKLLFKERGMKLEIQSTVPLKVRLNMVDTPFL